MSDFEVACYFCGETVGREGVDPIAVLIVASWLDEQSAEQQFFAHSECFRKAGAECMAAQIAVFEPDFGDPVE